MAHRRSSVDPDVARQAAARGDWHTSFEVLMELDVGGALDLAEVPLLAEVAYAAGHLDVTITAWERVHRSCAETDDHLGAAGAAARVAMHLLFDTALMAPVRAWLRRAERHLKGQPDSSAHAWHSVVLAYERLLSGDPDGAGDAARRAVDIGSKFEPAASAIGRVALARLLLIHGDIDDGLTLLADVGVTVTGGELDPLSSGVVYCELICALQGAAQYDLAEEWTEVMERWCATNAIGSLHGRCRVHRAEILRLRGRCSEAELEAVAACDELRPYLRRELGWPLTELGLIRLRRGDEAGAEEALLSAHELGWDAEPGLARLHLARGDTAGAADAVRKALDQPTVVPSKERPPGNDLQRAPLLAAQVEMEIANGDVERARIAVAELEAIARRFKSRALTAEAELALGRLCLTEGNAVAAESHLAAAAQIWRDIRAPYEPAITRGQIAVAHRLAGRVAQAEHEEQACRTLLDGIRGRASAPGDDAEPEAASPDPVCRMIREGEYWAVAFFGQSVLVRDLKGIHYLTRMLADPGREFHVLDLVAVENPRPARAEGVARRRNETTTSDDAGVMLDDEARCAYRRRLVEIEDDIDDARSAGDLGRAERAESEREFLVRELSSAFGIGGRSRKAGATSERARVAVTRALRIAISRISQHHQPLGEHLAHAVRTGTYCTYEPDPANPPRWQI